jgi:hypothetical protein
MLSRVASRRPKPPRMSGLHAIRARLTESSPRYRNARKAGAGNDRRAWPSTWVFRSLSDAIRQWNATGRSQLGRAILRA